MSDNLPERNIILDLNEIPPEPWEAPLPVIPAAKPRILVPGKDRTIGAFATELGQHLRPAQIYQSNDRMVVQKGRSTQFEEMRPGRFVTWLEKFVECYEGLPNEDGSGTMLRSISTATAARVLESEQFRSELPLVTSCNQIRQPVLDKDGRLVLLPTGYDEGSHTLTARGSTQYSLDVKLEDARTTLNQLLSEFCFADPAYGRAVQVSAMLTAYSMGLLSDTCIIPAFVYNANAAGVGKGLCVGLALVPVLGAEPAAATVKTEDEMGKWLFAGARAGERYLFLDNLDISLKDPWLEKFLTSSRVNARVLGSSANESHSKKAALFITGNRLTMRADMRRRSLVVDFFLPQARAEARQIRNPMDVGRILRESPQILGCLYALVREWAAAGKPGPSRVHPSFVEWSNVIAGIVEHAGFACPIPSLDVALDVDPETADMERLVGQMHAAARPFGMGFREVVTLCQTHGLFDGRLPTMAAERRGNTEFGRLLRRFDSQEFSNRLVFRMCGHGHARRYLVQPVTTEPAPCQQEPTTALADPVPPVVPTPEPDIDAPPSAVRMPEIVAAPAPVLAACQGSVLDSDAVLEGASEPKPEPLAA